MKKSFDLKLAEAKHPLITANGFKAELIGINRTRAQFGKKVLLYVVVTRNQDAPCFMYDVDGKRQQSGRLSESEFYRSDTNYDLYLDCPDVLRAITADELPDLFLVRFPTNQDHVSSKTNFLALAKTEGTEPAVLLPECAGNWVSITTLRRVGAEWKALLVHSDSSLLATNIFLSTWKKFEVVE